MPAAAASCKINRMVYLHLAHKHYLTLKTKIEPNTLYPKCKLPPLLLEAAVIFLILKT